MGILRCGFSFVLGTLSGVYVAQNYNLPNIRRMAKSGCSMAKRVEQTHRKQPTKIRDGDDEDDFATSVQMAKPLRRRSFHD